MFLLKDERNSKKRRRPGRAPYVAHIWDGADTACRMWSTGGLTNRKRYRVSATPEGRAICANCRAPQLDRLFQEALDREGD